MTFMDPNFLKSAVLIEISTKLNLLQPIDKTENSEICIERAHSSIINHFWDQNLRTCYIHVHIDGCFWSYMYCFCWWFFCDTDYSLKH